MNEKDKNVGKNVRQIRKNLGLSTKEFADYFHLSESTVKKYETGERVISNETLDMIKKDLLLTIDDFREAALPSIDFFQKVDSERITEDYIEKLFQIQFPIIKADHSVETETFQDASLFHWGSLYLVFEGFSLAVYLLKTSKKKYIEEKNNPALRPYVAANLISLTLFYASMINSLYAPDINLIGFATCIHLDLHPNTTSQKVFDGIDIKKHYEELHQDRVYNFLQQCLETVYNNKRLHDLSFYFRYWLIYFDLTNDIDNEAQKKLSTQQAFNYLIDTKNRYYVRCIKHLEKVLPGLKTLLFDLDQKKSSLPTG